LGRLVEKNLPDGEVVRFDYDLKGNLISAANGNITYDMEYDPSGRLLTIKTGTDLFFD